ncbi:MAG: hypothetical protein KA116_05605 [Proteobacteria bacterium]|nr:hypothetical protein [Pseudomonadota bacterium]
MSLKKIAFILFSGLLISSCASKKTIPSEIETPTPQTSSENELLAPPIVSEDIPKTNLPKAIHYGILIRAVGLDAFAALGFLQEMEKRGHKIDFIAGTGFGCWIAKNWGAQNRGNFTEWQSFKFSDWKSLESSLLDKVTPQHAVKRFEAYLSKISSTQRKNQDSIGWACPLFLLQNNQYSFVSGREMPFTENLMKELELDILGFGPFAHNPDFKSGSKYDYPLNQWVEKLDKLWTNERGDERAWIVLDTSFLVLEWSRVSNSHDIGLSNNNLRWARTAVTKLNNPEASQIKNFDLRRNYLLQGRNAAKIFFDHPRYQQFFAW